MEQKYRTTCFADAVEHYEASLQDSDTRKEPVIGFRVVHDLKHNISQGGLWSYDGEWCKGSYVFNNGWTNLHSGVGFRLVWGGNVELPSTEDSTSRPGGEA